MTWLRWVEHAFALLGLVAALGLSGVWVFDRALHQQFDGER